MSGCGEGTLRPIIYGLVVADELHEKARRGEVVLGGCSVGEDTPDWEYSDCGGQLRKSPSKRDVGQSG